MQLVQELTPVDHAKRIEFTTAQLDMIDANPDYLDNLLFSDEAHFKIHGEVSHHNFRYWSDENPHWHRETPLHSPRLTVWAAIGSCRPFLYSSKC
jgi:hypothetical protein